MEDWGRKSHAPVNWDADPLLVLDLGLRAVPYPPYPLYPQQSVGDRSRILGKAVLGCAPLILEVGLKAWPTGMSELRRRQLTVALRRPVGRLWREPTNTPHSAPGSAGSGDD